MINSCGVERKEGREKEENQFIKFVRVTSGGLPRLPNEVVCVHLDPGRRCSEQGCLATQLLPPRCPALALLHPLLLFLRGCGYSRATYPVAMSPVAPSLDMSPDYLPVTSIMDPRQGPTGLTAAPMAAQERDRMTTEEDGPNPGSVPPNPISKVVALLCPDRTIISGYSLPLKFGNLTHLAQTQVRVGGSTRAGSR